MASEQSRLLAEIKQLAKTAVFGTISETFRTCGNPNCRCHSTGPKHGPHMYVSFRGTDGKTTGYYVPKKAHESIRAGVEQWHLLQARLRDLADLNAQEYLSAVRRK